MSRIFKTKSGYTLVLRPVGPDLVVKCVKVDRATQGKTPEETAPAYLAMLSELFEEGIIKFELTKEQAALVTLARPMLKKDIPGLKNSVSDFALYIFHLCGGEYDELTRLALAILEETKNARPGKEKAKAGFLPFGRLKPVKK